MITALHNGRVAGSENTALSAQVSLTVEIKW